MYRIRILTHPKPEQRTDCAILTVLNQQLGSFIHLHTHWHGYWMANITCLRPVKSFSVDLDRMICWWRQYETVRATITTCSLRGVVHLSRACGACLTRTSNRCLLSSTSLWVVSVSACWLRAVIERTSAVTISQANILFILAIFSVIWLF